MFSIIKNLFSAFGNEPTDELRDIKPRHEKELVSSINLNRNNSSELKHNSSNLTPKNEIGLGPQEINIQELTYIPLPRAPKVWDVDGRGEFSNIYESTIFGPIFKASLTGLYNKAITLSKNIELENAPERVREEVAKCYRNQILSKQKSGYINAAINLSFEMMNDCKEFFTDVDKRRINTLIKKLDKSGKKHKYELVDAPKPSDTPKFSIVASAGYSLSETKSLNKDEKPESGFCLKSIQNESIVYFDRNGNSSLNEGFESTIVFKNRLTKESIRTNLKKRIHNCTANSAMQGAIVMDYDGQIIAFDKNLNSDLAYDLKNHPQVKRHFKTIETNYWGDSRSQVRCLDYDSNSKNYLFTLADEAWFCNLSGGEIWGVRMPLNEGWERVIERSSDSNKSTELVEALNILELSLPVRIEDVKKQYRILAKAYHPDHNPNNALASEKMRKLIDAFKIVTGIDPDMLDLNENVEKIVFKKSKPDYVHDMGLFRLEVTINGGNAQDWIYCACLKSGGSGAYLGTYSGKVFDIDASGMATLVYDPGECPNEIIDTELYLYLVTSTRLYIIKKPDALVAMVDIYNQGTVLVAGKIILLIDNKKIQWYDNTGSKLGEVTSTSPIRAIDECDRGLIVYTNQNSTIINGLSIK